MNAHTEEQFTTFMSQLLETNATLGFYCDFEKIKRNVADIEISLNMLNYLIGRQDLEAAVKSLWERDRKVFEILQILIAVRQHDNKKVVTTDGVTVPIKNYLTSPDGIMEYLKQTGLAKVFRDKSIKNLTDYVFGVEAGLDTHARKNRSGITVTSSSFKGTAANCSATSTSSSAVSLPILHIFCPTAG